MFGIIYSYYVIHAVCVEHDHHIILHELLLNNAGHSRTYHHLDYEVIGIHMLAFLITHLPLLGYVIIKLLHTVFFALPSVTMPFKLFKIQISIPHGHTHLVKFCFLKEIYKMTYHHILIATNKVKFITYILLNTVSQIYPVVSIT